MISCLVKYCCLANMYLQHVLKNSCWPSCEVGGLVDQFAFTFGLIICGLSSVTCGQCGQSLWIKQSFMLCFELQVME